MRCRLVLALAAGLSGVGAARGQAAVGQSAGGVVYAPAPTAGAVPAFGGPVQVMLVPDGGPPGRRRSPRTR